MENRNNSDTKNSHKHIISDKTEPVSSCCGGNGHMHHKEDSNEKEVFLCPMKCEENKTYDKEYGDLGMANMASEIEEETIEKVSCDHRNSRSRFDVG